MMNDKAFLKALRESNRKAWEEAYKRYYNTVRKFVKKTVLDEADEFLVKEVWQKTMIALFNQLQQKSDILHIDQYTYGIIQNIWRSVWREQSSQNISLEMNISPEIDHEASKALAEEARQQQLYRIVEDVFAQMKADPALANCVEIIRSKFFERQRDTAIAGILRLKKDSVKVRRSRICLPGFRQLLEKHPDFKDWSEGN
ncbi:MAG: sigma-70 family RNA polymerase sigma factor [Microscillaceae bacterium]|nr:sigma-70 family RNA polymerase sigma factor [Microscillaceae bacterium]